MLGERSVVLDLEGFRFKKNAFVVKEIAITTSDYSDRLNFLPPVNFNILPKLEQKAYNWLQIIYTVSIGKTVITFT